MLSEAHAFMAPSPDEDKDIWVIPLDVANQIEGRLEGCQDIIEHFTARIAQLERQLKPDGKPDRIVGLR